MMQQLFFLAICLLTTVSMFPNLAMAQNLTIQGPTQTEAERPTFFKAYFDSPTDGRIDVTDQVQWDSYQGYSRGQGVLVFPASPSLQTQYRAHVRASYFDEQGQSYGASTYITVDSTPQFIEIRGPFSVTPGSTHFFRAYGIYYGSKQMELTSYGRWWAQLGRFSSYGNYMAPGHSGRDTITFTYGYKTERFSVNIY